MRLLYFLVGALCAFSTSGQTFVNMNNALGLQVFVTDNLYGSGVSYVDVDQNGLDDLTFCTNDAIKVYLNFDGTSVPVEYGFTVDEDAKHPTWVDFDNDGDLDFFFTQYGNPLKLYRNDGDMNFVDVSSISGLPSNNTNDFGACWGDYDRDGDLDLYVCTYIYLYSGSDAYEWNDHLYRNNGDGTFEDVSGFANVQDGISVSFQSVWIDYNNDRWPDLYVINDKEHPNRLYHNNGDGTFTDIAQENGSSIDMVDAMTASCGDFNNDGFEDIFVTNTSIGDCALLRNEGDGTFTEIANEAGVDLDILGWAGNWFDFDLDADLDLYVCEYYPLFSSQTNAFMLNNGDETFGNVISSVFPYDFSNSYSSAMGDWNDDGYPDLAVNNYSFQNANMWQNSGGQQHFIKFDLEGVVSNRNGIGSRIQLFHDSVYQTRQTYCGENYLGQNSFVQIVGLADDNQVDSVIVEWNSGFVDRFFSLSANDRFHFVEGSSYAPNLSVVDTLLLCPGDSVLVLAQNGSNFQWNTGEFQDSKWISASGEYFVNATHELGFVGESAHLIVVSESLEPEEILIHNVSCFGGANGQLIASPADSLFFTWTDAPDAMSMSDLVKGFYHYEFVGQLGCVRLDSVEVVQHDEMVASAIVQDALCFGSYDGTASFLISGGVGPYSLAWNDTNPDGLGASDYSIGISDSLGCEIIAGFVVEEPNELIVEIMNIACEKDLANFSVLASGGTGDIELEWNTGVEGTVLEDVPSSGVYSVTATDENGCAKLLENIECPTSVGSLSTLKPMLFPNPAQNTVTILNWNMPIDEAWLVDMTGRSWSLKMISIDKSIRLDISETTAGVYVVVIRNDQFVFQETLIIK